MNKRDLGNSGIKVSEIGYGAAALFGKDVLGKQGISEDTAYELVSTAIRHGINFFDTGINYGYAEKRLGRCIEKAIRGGIRRENLVIETKFAEKINSDGSYGDADWSPEWLNESIHISLNRLKLEYIDLYAMHGGGIEDCSDKLIAAFQSLKSQGLIRAYGINTFDTDVIEWVAKEKNFDFVMLDYNIMRQNREPLIEKLNEAGIGVIAGSALGESLYSKNIYKVKSRNDLWYLARAVVRFRGLMKKSKDFRFLTKQDGYTANQLALRYVLDNDRISSAVFGTIDPDHLEENIKAESISMPEKIKKEIKKRA